jgi:formiminotetrahydrofolate cyclodeaminase
MSRETLSAQPVSALLEDVAKGNLAPGGISMTALSGAIASSLVGLVGRLTAGKPGYEPLTEEMERAVERAYVLQEQLLGAMDQEVEAFNQLVGSAALPRGSEEEAAIRRDCLRIAVRGYTQVPLQIGQLGMEIVRLTETVVRYGNREVIADGGTAFLLAVSAVKGAALHVLLNARGADEEWATQAREKAHKWLSDLEELERDLWAHLLNQVERDG